MKNWSRIGCILHGYRFAQVDNFSLFVKRKISFSRHVLSKSFLTAESQKFTCRSKIPLRLACKSCIFNSINSHKSWMLFSGCNPTRQYCTVDKTSRSTDHEETDKLFSTRYIFVRTSVSRWEDVPNGVILDVGYVDSMEIRKNNRSQSNIPVILGIPDVTQDHYDLACFLKPFVKSGYRVVIVNLPGSPFCRGKTHLDDKIYQMSVSEHAEFISDFLFELNIDRVNMVVTNRHSVYTGVRLCVVHKDVFHSLAMLNPPGLHLTKLMNYPVLHKMIANRFEREGRSVQWLIQHVLTRCVKGYLQLGDLTSLQVITFCRNMSTLSFVDEETNASNLKTRSTPLLACFGEDCEFLDVKSTKDYLSLMGIEESSFLEIDDEQRLFKRGNREINSTVYHITSESGNKLEDNPVLIRRLLWNFFMQNHPNL